MQGLEGVKVLELGHMVSAAYTTKLMADLGADVIKVEEPGGDQARSARAISSEKSRYRTERPLPCSSIPINVQ